MKHIFIIATMLACGICSASASNHAAIQHKWATQAELCSGLPDNSEKANSACDQARVAWDALTASGCSYKAAAHSFSAKGWICK